jgi:hypothetical protein
MPHIVLTEEQARVLQQSTLAVELRDEQGPVLARVPPPTEEQIIERIKQNRNDKFPRYPAREVQARLRRLEEISQQEEVDEVRAKELIRRMRTEEGE